MFFEVLPVLCGVPFILHSRIVSIVTLFVVTYKVGLSAPGPVSAATFTRTVSAVFPADPSLPKPRAATQPFLLPVARYVPHLPDCAQPPRRSASGLPLPPHPQRANASIAILSFPAAAAAPSPTEVRAASTSATPIAHRPALRSGACARRVRAVRRAFADRAAAAHTAPQSPDA